MSALDLTETFEAGRRAGVDQVRVVLEETEAWAAKCQHAIDDAELRETLAIQNDDTSAEYAAARDVVKYAHARDAYNATAARLRAVIEG